MDLLSGERIDLSKRGASLASPRSEDEVNEKYARGDVRIVTEQARYPLSTIVSLLDSGDYELNPEFQRRHRWSADKQSRLIESFIMNVPIPPIFLYETRYSHYEVMDGLQRLTAISEYYRGRYALRGLSEWAELNGMSYDELPEQVRRGIDRRYLSSIILLQETAKSEKEALRLKQLVFERINSGGVNLEPQESRNALYNGPLNQLCLRLSERSSFRRMWGIPTREDFTPGQARFLFDPDEDPPSDYEDALAKNRLYQKMGDVELVLRFFAYRQIDHVDQGRLADFLDEFLSQGNLFDHEVFQLYEQLFCETCDLLYELLGERAFFLRRRRRNGGWGWFERPTKVLYDPLMAATSERLEYRDRLLERSGELARALETFYESEEELFAGRSTNKQDLIRRRQAFRDLLDEQIR